MTEEVKIETLDGGSTQGGAACTDCAQRAQETEESETTNFAFLLALTPVLALTFFGQVGLL